MEKALQPSQDQNLQPPDSQSWTENPISLSAQQRTSTNLQGSHILLPHRQIPAIKHGNRFPHQPFHVSDPSAKVPLTPCLYLWTMYAFMHLCIYGPASRQEGKGMPDTWKTAAVREKSVLLQISKGYGGLCSSLPMPGST